MAEFRIRRADVLKNVGTCDLIDIFDKTAKRQGNTDLVYPDGWQPVNTRNLLRESPRALWMMAKAGLIPLTEEAALKVIVDAGQKIENPVARLAKVRTRPMTKIMSLRMKAHADRRMALR